MVSSQTISFYSSTIHFSFINQHHRLTYYKSLSAYLNVLIDKSVMIVLTVPGQSILIPQLYTVVIPYIRLYFPRFNCAVREPNRS